MWTFKGAAKVAAASVFVGVLAASPSMCNLVENYNRYARLRDLSKDGLYAQVNSARNPDNRPLAARYAAADSKYQQCTNLDRAMAVPNKGLWSFSSEDHKTFFSTCGAPDKSLWNIK